MKKIVEWHFPVLFLTIWMVSVPTSVRCNDQALMEEGVHRFMTANYGRYSAEDDAWHATGHQIVPDTADKDGMKICLRRTIMIDMEPEEMLAICGRSKQPDKVTTDFYVLSWVKDKFETTSSLIGITEDGDWNGSAMSNKLDKNQSRFNIMEYGPNIFGFDQNTHLMTEKYFEIFRSVILFWHGKLVYAGHYTQTMNNTQSHTEDDCDSLDIDTQINLAEPMGDVYMMRLHLYGTKHGKKVNDYLPVFFDAETGQFRFPQEAKEVYPE